MKTISVMEAQQDLALMMEQVLVGAQPVMIEAQNGLQTVLLSLAQYQILNAAAKDKNEPTVPVRQRVLGLGVGDIWMSDDFDEPLLAETKTKTDGYLGLGHSSSVREPLCKCRHQSSSWFPS